ncbi:trypsin-like peptidase domain-containing protein [Variovorax sp. RA8]|uniref:trypsin-like peptidase domain-containing protein n=1 Tax=Variovorax sp. (strain JCM 16519 / RA8) TaxID=662548 RepID=UPI0013199BE9|nr:trypsin-like peptidase domain-containing protein [Variovorax sp. RA8]VTU21599.1 putative periplasmic serine endoprotease DegP-like precursor [Variovorax sp. RA8]
MPGTWIHAGWGRLLQGGVFAAVVAGSGACTTGAIRTGDPVAHARSPVAAPAPPLQAGSVPDYRAIVQREGPAVVGITTAGVHTLSPTELPPGLEDDPGLQLLLDLLGLRGDAARLDIPFRNQGSGFIIGSDGLILSSAHVVRDAAELKVKLGDRREFKAKVLGSDPVTDTALLRIDARGLPVVRVGDVEQLQVGDPVLAIGSPFGFEQTATQGIVSAKGRALPGDIAVPLIQTDAAVNPGSSGGPLFDGSGAVVGINAQIYSHSGGYQGLSFAIPIDVALKVKDQILATGRMSHARLGATIQDLDQALAEAFGLDAADGALISGVAPGNAAAAAGLQPGDVITRIDGERIGRAADLTSRIGLAAPGQTVRLSVWRDRRTREMRATLGRVADAEDAKPPAGGEREGAPFSLELRPLTAKERAQRRLEGGLMVEGVAGVTARESLQPGDVLLAINGVAVNSVDQANLLTRRGSGKVALLIDRDGSRRYVAVELGASRPSGAGFQREGPDASF